MVNQKISKYPWQNSLSKLLRSNLANLNGTLRLAIVGIGNELNGDDAAGSMVARTLREKKGAEDVDRLLVIDAGVAPENITGELRAFNPGLIVFVDAADMGEAPGTVRWIGMEEIDGMSASTHRMPLSMLAKYLTLELGCDIVLLGIQPTSVEMGKGLSDPVRRVVDLMSDDLCDVLKSGRDRQGVFVKMPEMRTSESAEA